MENGTEITAESLLRMLYDVQPYIRAEAVWTMSQETLDQIKELPEADRNGPGTLLFGKPIRIKPNTEGVKFGLDPDKPRRIHGRKFLEALGDAGIIRAGDYVRRVVIDASVDNAVIVYAERIGDDRLLNVALGLTGIEITGVPIPDGA